MKHLPLLLGVEEGLVAVVVGDLPAGVAVGVVILIAGALVDNPVWARLARALQRRAIPSVLVEMPGHGLNRAVDPSATVDALASARAYLREAGVPEVVLVTAAAGLKPAAVVAADEDDVVKLIVAGLPLPDAAERLARNVGALDYVRRGLRLTNLSAVADAERRRRYLELARAKVAVSMGRQNGSRGEHETSGFPTGPAVPEVVGALDAGTHLFVLCGTDDRCRRNATELDAALNGPGSLHPDTRLHVDTSFAGRVTGFGSIRAQDWFIERVVSAIGVSGSVSSARA